MKTGQMYSTFVGVYLFSLLVGVTGVPLTTNSWNYGTHPVPGTVITILWGAACVAKGVVSCAVAGIAALLLTVVMSFRAQGTGQQGGAILPVHNRSPGGDIHKVWHDLGDGEVRDYLDTSSLQVGKDHIVWDNKGNVYTATKHPKTNDNVLKIHLGATMEETPAGRTIVKPAKARRSTTPEVDQFAASWSYSGTAYDDYSEDDAQADAQQVEYDLVGGSNFSELLAPYDCSTLTPTNGDDEKANISITPMGPGLSDEIAPACGA